VPPCTSTGDEATRDTARMKQLRGAYPADRAAALSGVPVSTVHYWARQEILVPSISPVRIRLWSYADLMGLRTIYWLRQTKQSPEGREVPRSTMPAVRTALNELRELDVELWSATRGHAVAVDRAGRIVLSATGGIQEVTGQRMLSGEMLDLLAPFRTHEGSLGPDLLAPRPHLRIIPGKLSGAPHIEDTRVETEALGALARRGFSSSKIHRLYPAVDPRGVDDALDLEGQLTRNLKVAA
jgi:uncharacterized protein (DUF433 family)